jgi:predicted phosphodiesterase
MLLKIIKGTFCSFVIWSILQTTAMSQTDTVPQPVGSASQTHFVIISDNHFIQPDRKDCDWCSGLYSATVTALEFIKGTVKPEFVIYLGDQISGEGTIEISEDESLELTKLFMKEVGTILSVPYYAVWGNHDGPNFPKVYGYKNKAVIIGGRLFYLLGIELTDYWGGSGKFSDWKYLEESLKNNAGVPTLVFTHEPIYSPTFDNALKVKKFIEKYPQIKIVFQGHTHNQQIVRSGSIIYFTCEGFLKKPKYSFYDIVLNGDRVEITRYDFNDGKYVGVEVLNESLSQGH